ncbi:MAG: flagellar basal-body MS-ring/collar protein FliF [Acidimicrobiales bacterium]
MEDERTTGAARLLEPISSMAPHQMAISALLALAAIVGSFALFQWSTAPAYQAFLVGEEPSVVSDSITELESAGIPYRVSAGGTTLEVPRDQLADAEVRLAAAGVSGSSVTGYELLDDQGFSTSSFQQRINFQRALEGELTRTIMEMDHVLVASVHLSIPEDELFTDDEEPPTAAVVIDPAGTIGRQGVDGIVSVVSSAVPGMAPEGVTVTDTSGRVLTDNGSAASSSGLEARRSLEQQLETSAQTMLIAAFGPENAMVRVSAELDLDDSERETVTYNPESQIAIREQIIQESYVADGDDAAGIVGVTDDINTGIPDLEAGGSDYTRNEQTSEYGIDRVRTVERNSSGDVTRLSVAVVVNESLDPQPDLAQVAQVVSAAVGLNEARGDVIAVEAIPFDEEFAADIAEFIPEPPAADPLAPIAPYLGILKTAFAVLLLVLVVLSLRKGTKTLTATLKPVAVDLTAIEAADAESSSSGDEISKSGDSDASENEGSEEALALERGAAAADDVMRIIDQQPIEVASLLRSWANDAAVSN